MTAIELNLDGLVGPTHNYAGLSYGNIASHRSKLSISNPRDAALQGLAKMKSLADLGVKQAVLAPQSRPDLNMLRRLGFTGSDEQILTSAAREDPALLAACYSASSMWAANAATISPSADCADGRVHFTPANLVTQFHRSLEAQTTSRILRAIFPDEAHFAHHDPLPPTLHFADEGAANHMRLAPRHGAPGLEIFVYGRSSLHTDSAPARFPARQTLEASRAIARLQRLDPSRTIFLRQNPDAIDAGVFHNDVAAVANENVLLVHERAYADPDPAAQIRDAWKSLNGGDLFLICIPESDVPLADAVDSYLFNSQLVTLTDSSMALICPIECQQLPRPQTFLQRLVQSGQTPIRSVHFVDVRQSMRNGGGPACLRLRVVLTPAEFSRMSQSLLLTDDLYHNLTAWIHRHYRDRLSCADLADPALLHESRAALSELAQMLALPTFS